MYDIIYCLLLIFCTYFTFCASEEVQNCVKSTNFCKSEGKSCKHVLNTTYLENIDEWDYLRYEYNNKSLTLEYDAPNSSYYAVVVARGDNLHLIPSCCHFDPKVGCKFCIDSPYDHPYVIDFTEEQVRLIQADLPAEMYCEKKTRLWRWCKGEDDVNCLKISEKDVKPIIFRKIYVPTSTQELDNERFSIRICKSEIKNISSSSSYGQVVKGLKFSDDDCEDKTDVTNNKETLKPILEKYRPTDIDVCVYYRRRVSSDWISDPICYMHSQKSQRDGPIFRALLVAVSMLISLILILLAIYFCRRLSRDARIEITGKCNDDILNGDFNDTKPKYRPEKIDEVDFPADQSYEEFGNSTEDNHHSLNVQDESVVLINQPGLKCDPYSDHQEQENSPLIKKLNYETAESTPEEKNGSYCPKEDISAQSEKQGIPDYLAHSQLV